MWQRCCWSSGQMLTNKAPVERLVQAHSFRHTHPLILTPSDTHIHTHTSQTYTHTHLRCTHTHTHTHTHIHLHNLYTHTHTFTHLRRTHTHIHTTFRHTHTHTHLGDTPTLPKTYTHTFTHPQTHVHTPSQMCLMHPHTDTSVTNNWALHPRTNNLTHVYHGLVEWWVWVLNTRVPQLFAYTELHSPSLIYTDSHQHS